jgi:hypothetical protein
MQRDSVDKNKTPRKDDSLPVEEEDDGVAGFLPDLLRRGLTLGFTGFFLTEEAVRKALGESVPRDLMDFILAQSERTRAEFLERMSKEFARAFSVFEPVELAKQLLEGNSIEVNASIRLVPSNTEEEKGGPKRSGRKRDESG